MEGGESTLASQKTHHASGVITTPRGVVLVKDTHQPKPQWWSGPGGKGKLGETPQKTFVRELEEETGLRVNSKQLRLIRKSRVKNCRYFVFTTHIDDLRGLKRCGNEGEGIQFVPLSELRSVADLSPHFLLTLSLCENLI